jgi:hypothetical protein
MHSSIIVFLLIGIVSINLTYAAQIPDSEEFEELLDEMKRERSKSMYTMSIIR